MESLTEGRHIALGVATPIACDLSDSIAPPYINSVAAIRLA